jgi:NADH dehydrogenase/NADH:ubiquinone oxidoreductase subunit G
MEKEKLVLLKKKEHLNRKYAIQLHCMNRCILCYRCVMVADQLTDNVYTELWIEEITLSTCISKAVDNEFSGNMIDVCPVGALTDKTFRFKSRVWFNKPYDAYTEIVIMFANHKCLDKRKTTLK